MSRLAKIYAWISRGGLLWVALALHLSIGWLWYGGLLGADFKAGEPRWYWITWMVLVLSIPAAALVVYLSSWAERLWGQKRYVIPAGVFWLWTLIIGCALFIAGLSWVLRDGYWFYGDILRGLYFPLGAVYVGGALVLWFIPHTPRFYPRMVGILIGIMISFTLVLGLVSQNSRIMWFFASSEEQRDAMQRKQHTVTVIFRKGVSTEQWQQYLEQTNWSVFGYRVRSTKVVITRCTGERLAELSVRDNLERVREKFRQQVSDIDWYDVCVAQMSVRGVRGNEFEKAIKSQSDTGPLVESIDWD